MMELNVIVLDVESTGVTPHPKLGYPQVVELGYIELDELGSKPELEEGETLVDYFLNKGQENKFVKRYKPSIPIHPDAVKIHGITYKDVFNCDSSESLELPEGLDYIIGHNVQYDHRCLGKPDIKLICTLKIAKKFSKFAGVTFPDHKLDTLVKYYYPDEYHKLEGKYHNALNDCIKCILILYKMLEQLPGVKTWTDLYNFQQTIKV
jgi:exodeoxyribonuclease X